ncbi:MAG: phosphoribosylglycinamide formyltransferase [Candidatus Desulfovibrio kirbyi]|uniref:Phosphoribosylglycinamide formyltransferase n=1 Tax=Candidatus Desulfovibrio kirbyi TaxID=2696086 RepID=A0A6L2R5C1_9BACT|nr:MAG: phosphoribosylglycinamide formyltransferase [Candidatus Desulfovibrio kirbyi]
MALNIALLASGNGTNVQAIINNILAGVLDANICLIAANRPQAFVLERARRAGLPFCALDHTVWPDRAAFDNELAAVVKDHGAELVALAGYMRLLTPAFLTHFPNKIVNLHPSLLPSFPGTRAGADAVTHGVKISGCTVHFVEEHMDSGPIIIQAAVPVNPDEQPDALMRRIHGLEHRIYPQALQWLSEDRIRLSNRQTILSKGTRPQLPQPAGCLVCPPLEQGF